MKIKTTFYVFLLSIVSIYGQYSIDISLPSDGNNCDGFMLFRIPIDAGIVDLELIILDPVNSEESIVDVRNNWRGQGYFRNLCPGDYILRVHDSFGCSKDLSTTIDGECDEIILTVPPPIISASNCENNGKIVFAGSDPANNHFSGLTNPVEFEWSNGNFGPVNDNLFSGTYQLTVTDDNLCSKSFEFDVPGSNEAFSVDTYSEPSCEGLNTGEALVIPTTQSSSNQVEFLFFWYHNGQTEQGAFSNLVNMPSGDYQVRVSLMDGSCPPIETSVTVEELDDSGPLSLTLGEMTPTCFGSNSGTAEIFVQGGTPPYDVISSIGIPYVSGEKIVQLSSGTQLITVNDQCGQEVSAYISIDSYEPFEVFVSEKGFENCDLNKGQIRFESYEPFMLNHRGTTYNSQNSNNNPNRFFILLGSLEEGVYDFYPSNINGCTKSILDIELEHNEGSNLELTILDEQVHCLDNRVLQPVLGGSPPYSYVWELDGRIISTKNPLEASPNGLYTFTVIDACLNKVSKEINFTCDCTSVFSIRLLTCPDPGEGKMKLTINWDHISLLKIGQHNFKWTFHSDPPIINEGSFTVLENNGMTWEGDQIVKFPAQPTYITAEIIDPEGCVFLKEWLPFWAMGTEFPTMSRQHDERLLFWTQNEEDEIEVATDCFTTEYCAGFATTEDSDNPDIGISKKFHYIPADDQFPCAGGEISCPDDFQAKFSFVGNGIPIQIETGPDKCGCLFDVGTIYPNPSTQVEVNLNDPILAVFDCDGEDVTIGVDIDIANDLYFPNDECEGIIQTDFNEDNCTATLSCYIDGVAVGDPIDEFPIGQYKYFTQNCQSTLNYLIIYSECTNEESCEDRVNIIEYNMGGGTILIDKFLNHVNFNTCYLLIGSGPGAVLYRDLCRNWDNTDYDEIIYDPVNCYDWLSNKFGCVPVGPPPGVIGTGGSETPNETPSLSIRLFPNPTKGSTIVQFPNDILDSKFTLRMSDVYGKEVYYQEIKTDNSAKSISIEVLETSTFAPGIYFVEVLEKGTNQKMISKLIIQ